MPNSLSVIPVGNLHGLVDRTGAALTPSEVCVRDVPYNASSSDLEPLYGSDYPKQSIYDEEVAKPSQVQEEFEPWSAKAIPYYFIMIAAVFTWACQPVLFQYLPVKDPFLRMVWWFMITIIWLTPSITKHFATITPEQKAFYTSFRCMLILLFVIVVNRVWTFAWMMALQLTTLTHVSMFVQLHPLMFVFIKLVRRERVGILEMIGVVIGYMGVILVVGGVGARTVSRTLGLTCIQNHATNKNGPYAIYGDLLALCSSICVVGYVYGGRFVRRTLPASVIPFFGPIGTEIIAISVLFIKNDPTPTLDMDGETGLFGFLSNMEVFGVTLALGISTALAAVLNTTAIKVLPTLFISTSLLLEPVFATAMGVLVGVCAIPGPYTLFGGSLTLSGVALVLVGGFMSDKKSKEMSNAMGDRMVELDVKLVDVTEESISSETSSAGVNETASE